MVRGFKVQGRIFTVVKIKIGCLKWPISNFYLITNLLCCILSIFYLKYSRRLRHFCNAKETKVYFQGTWINENCKDSQKESVGYNGNFVECRPNIEQRTNKAILLIIGDSFSSSKCPIKCWSGNFKFHSQQILFR